MWRTLSAVVFGAACSLFGGFLAHSIHQSQEDERYSRAVNALYQVMLDDCTPETNCAKGDEAIKGIIEANKLYNTNTCIGFTSSGCNIQNKERSDAPQD